MKTIKFGIIGCGLMGREFASAVARWCHLLPDIPRPEIVAVCDYNPDACAWFTKHFPSIRLATRDYRELIAQPEIEAVYCALPHNLHAEVYAQIIRAGKHLPEQPGGFPDAGERVVKAVLQFLIPHRCRLLSVPPSAFPAPFSAGL